MSDEYYVIVWADGHEEKVLATVKVQDGCLVVVEHYGVTFGEKSRRVIPLSRLREWRTANDPY